VTVGGETCYPFYQFEGDMPNKPRIAMEIWDMAPEEWPEAAMAPFKDVLSDPAAWAKKCVDEYGAEMIVLQLKSTDPNGQMPARRTPPPPSKKSSAPSPCR
jgi:acetyl-CoA decarbonylase/synthase complex subunit delta